MPLWIRNFYFVVTADWKRRRLVVTYLYQNRTVFVQMRTVIFFHPKISN